MSTPSPERHRPRPSASASGGDVTSAGGAGLGAGLWSRNFSLFFAARTVAKLGDLMLPVALAAGLVREGGGAGAVGAAMASFTASFAGLVIFGGVFADRFDTRRLMIGSDLVRVVTQTITALLFITGHVALWGICLIGVINGVCAAMFQPGVASTVPLIARDVQAANAAVRTAESGMAVLGPATAGVLVGLTSAGGVFAVHAGTYLVSALCLVALRLPPGPRPPAVPGGERTAFRADLAEGWREFVARPWMWGVIVIWMVFMGAAWGPSVPLAATEIITEHGERVYGLINSGLGVGMVMGGLLALRIRPVRPLRAGAVALFGFALQPAAIGASLPVAMITGASVVAGAALAFWGVMWATSVQTQVPGAVLNRIHAYEVAGSLVMLPVGQALAGPAAGLFGAQQVLLAGGVVSLAVCGALLSVPAIRRLRRVDAPPDAGGGVAKDPSRDGAWDRPCDERLADS
ncbi:MFS transporter [Streptomyces profundus]|uniref:MFS transporter n=1 Tax=Streptomyces profundus TaxID=2867410 RepID=UPI001D160410|nr:MFS transporter [Streptomyces sp. MA3_2.13]UED85863.1 MFS transporter [Streptomyces sp. MA3_2.13]